MNNGLTIKDATERWVHEMNAIPQDMIEKLMNIGDGDIHEVTEPAVGDSVYFTRISKEVETEKSQA